VKFEKKTAKLIPYGSAAALLGSLLIAPSLTHAQENASTNNEPLRLTVAPHTSSRIAMKTLPKATCTLHADGDSASSRSLKLFADDEGMIRFNVNPSQESDEAAAFAVDCTSGSESRTFALQLRPHSVPTEDMPAPSAEKRAPQATDVIRPALTEERARQLTDDELIQGEYPARPNAQQAPAAYANWLRMVTRDARRVESRQTEHPELRASTLAGTSNWSGFDLKNAPGEVPVSTYDFVEGEWVIPTVTNAVYDTTTYSVMWIGLDGDDGICPQYCNGGHTSDLWQAGTGQEITSVPLHLINAPLTSSDKAATATSSNKAEVANITGIGIGAPVTPSYTFTTYFAWTELLPAQGIMTLPNFNVHPGDEVFMETWVGNAGQGPSLSGVFAIALVEDLTQGEYTYVYNSITPGQVLGYQAEWIMERPYEGGVLPDLADYNYAYMYDAFAELTNGSWVTYDQSSAQQLFMYGSTGNLLSAAYAYNSGTIYYEWVALK
jgi:hypothetical protein